MQDLVALRSTPKVFIDAGKDLTAEGAVVVMRDLDLEKCIAEVSHKPGKVNPVVRHVEGGLALIEMDRGLVDPQCYDLLQLVASLDSHRIVRVLGEDAGIKGRRTDECE